MEQSNFLTSNVQIEQRNGKVLVSSYQVAEKFNKEHKHVLRNSKDLLLDLPSDLRKSNFGLSCENKPMPRNRGTKKAHYYTLTKEGFLLLAMGFTVKEAMQWKIELIQAFDALEQAYIASLQNKQQKALPTKQQDTLKSTLKAFKLVNNERLTHRQVVLTFGILRRTLSGRLQRMRDTFLWG